MSSLFSVGAGVVVLLVLAVIGVFLWQLSRGALGGGARAFRLVQRGAWIAAAVFGVVAVVTLLTDLFAPSLTMTVPMTDVWPLPLPGVDADTGATAVESSGITLSTLTLTGVTLPVRLLWAGGHALSILLPAAVSALVALAAGRLREGAPFSPVLARSTRWAAWTVLVAGSTASVLTGIAGSMASYQALQVRSASWTGYPDDWMPTDALPSPTVHIEFAFWPIGVGIALLLVAAILQSGIRLGAEKERLQKDTEGLV